MKYFGGNIVCFRERHHQSCSTICFFGSHASSDRFLLIPVGSNERKVSIQNVSPLSHFNQYIVYHKVDTGKRKIQI